MLSYLFKKGEGSEHAMLPFAQSRVILSCMPLGDLAGGYGEPLGEESVPSGEDNAPPQRAPMML